MQPVQTGAQIEFRGGINRPPLERTPAVVALFDRDVGFGGQRPGSPVGFWDGKLLRQNHGPENLAGTLVFWAAAWVWARFGVG